MQVLTNLLRTYNVAPPDRPGHESAEVAAALRSLGYVSGSAPERKVFTEADDPKSLVEVDRDLHTASELYQAGKVQEAIAMLNGVIARRPDTADAYISLAHAYWEAGHLQPAIATLEKALATARRTATCASASASTSPRARPIPRARSSCSKAFRSAMSKR